MVEELQSTEAKILDAARTVFLRKGFDGCRMQEIADEAGINKSLLHYYFRSKDNLFDAVFMEAFQSLFKRIFDTLESSNSLEDKVRFLFKDYITFIQLNPFIPSFILNSLQYNPERVTDLFDRSVYQPSKMFSKLEESLVESGLKNIDPRQFVVNLVALSVFPIIAKPLIIKILNFTEEEYNSFIEVRKELLPELVFKSIRSL